jgi:mitogen-activated protein kinase 1/3
MYLVMEMLETDLHRIIRSNQTLSESHCKCIMKQLLEAVKAMHSVNVFHRDLKPGNILVTKDCHIRVTDFGLARYMHNSTLEGRNDANPITKTVVTTLYRCPELLLSPDDMPYTAAIDLWSVGCIHAELLLRRPVFPGKNEMTTVQKIFEIFGYRGDEDFGFPLSSDARRFLHSKCRFPKQIWPRVLPTASDAALQVIDGLLKINPSTRLSAVDALAMPFFEDAEVFYDYLVNYVAPPKPSYFAFEECTMSVVNLTRLIQEEVQAIPMTGYAPAELEQGRAAVAAGSLLGTPRSPSPTAGLVRPTTAQKNESRSRSNSNSNNGGNDAAVLSQEKTAPRGIAPAGGPAAGGRSKGDNPFANNARAVRKGSKENVLSASSADNAATAKAMLAEDSPLPDAVVQQPKLPKAQDTSNKDMTAPPTDASKVPPAMHAADSNRSYLAPPPVDGGTSDKAVSGKSNNGSSTAGGGGSFWSRLFLCGGGPSPVKQQAYETSQTNES